MTRQRVTRREMGLIIREMLGGGDTLPKLTDAQALYLRATYEVMDYDPTLVITPPGKIPGEPTPAKPPCSS